MKSLHHRNILLIFSFILSSIFAQADTVDDRMEKIRLDHVNNPYPSRSGCNGMAAYALACLYEGINVTDANDEIAAFELNCDPPDDGSFGDWDGYFEMPLMIRIYLLSETYANLTPSSVGKVESMMWNFINSRSKYADAIGTVWIQSGSENHDLVRKTSYLLIAQALMDSSSYSSTTLLDDNHTLQEHYDAWESYLFEYFRQRAREGLHAEIASPTYQKETLACYLNIYDLSENAALQEQAGKVIDLMMADVANEYMATVAVRGGAEARAYKDKLQRGLFFPIRQWLYAYNWHDDDGGPESHHFILHAATSDYRIPSIITAIATDPDKENYLYSTRRFGQGSTYAGGGDNLSDITFDTNHAANIRRDTYVTPSYTLGGMTFQQNDGHIKVLEQNRTAGVFFATDVDDRISVYGKGASNEKSYRDLDSLCVEDCLVVARHMAPYSSGDTMMIFLSNDQVVDNFEEDLSSDWFFTRVGLSGFVDRLWVSDEDSVDSLRNNHLMMGPLSGTSSEPTLSITGGGSDGIGKSLVFDGDHEATAKESWAAHNTVHVELDFKTTQADLSESQILATAASTWEVRIRNDDVQFTIWTDSTAYTLTLSGVVTANTWSNVIASVDASGEMYLEVDGISTSQTADTLKNQTKTITLGNKPGTVRYLYGELDNILISLDGTTNTEIAHWQMESLSNFDAYCAIRLANGTFTQTTVTHGDILEISDPWAPIVIQTGEASNYSSYADFKASVRSNTFTYADNKLTYVTENGDTIEYFAKTSSSSTAILPKVNFATVELNPYMSYESPYIKAYHGSDRVLLSYPGYSDLEIDFTFSGAHQRDDYQTVALWHMDELVSGEVPDDDAYNAGRNLDLTLDGATLTTGTNGKFLEGLSFDGVNDQAYVGSGWQGQRAVKVQFWMKSLDTTTATNRTIVNATSTWQIHQVADELFFVVYTDSAARVLSIDNILTASTWHYVVAEIDEFGHMILKLDDQLVESDGLPLKQQTKSIYLGNKQNQTRWFNGVLDEVKITVPTTNFPSPVDDASTLALWHMESINGNGDVPDDDSNNAGRDADLILTGPLLTVTESGIPGKALLFDGIDDIATSTNNWESTNDTVRVEFWMNSNTDSLGSNQTIITATSTWQIHLVEDDLSFVTWGDTSANTLTLDNCINAYQWHKVIAWIDANGNVRLEVDGQSVTASAEPLKNQTKTITIGNKSTTDRWFGGMLDEIKISSF